MTCARCHSPNAVIKGSCLMCGHLTNAVDPLDVYYETSADVPHHVMGGRKRTIVAGSMEDEAIARVDAMRRPRRDTVR